MARARTEARLVLDRRRRLDEVPAPSPADQRLTVWFID
jgi:hypothetical protein